MRSGCEVTDRAPQISTSVLKSRAPLRTCFPTLQPWRPSWPLTPLVALPSQVHPRHGCHPQHPRGTAATLLDGRAMATLPSLIPSHLEPESSPSKAVFPLVPSSASPFLALSFWFGVTTWARWEFPIKSTISFTNKARSAFALCQCLGEWTLS